MVGFCNFFTSFCQVKLRIFQKEIVYNNSSSIVVFFLVAIIEKNGAGRVSALFSRKILFRLFFPELICFKKSIFSTLVFIEGG